MAKSGDTCTEEGKWQSGDCPECNEHAKTIDMYKDEKFPSCGKEDPPGNYCEGQLNWERVGDFD